MIVFNWMGMKRLQKTKFTQKLDSTDEKIRATNKYRRNVIESKFKF